MFWIAYCKHYFIKVWHSVSVTTERNGTFEYVITMTDPDTGDTFTLKQGTFQLRPGEEYELYVPDGAALLVRLISDHGGYTVEWDDRNPLTRQYGEVYTLTIRTEMELTMLFVPIPSPGPTPWLWTMIIGFGLLFLIFFLGGEDEEIYGRVTKDGKGVPDAKVGYTVNGGARKVVKTDKDGDYSIPVQKGNNVVITDVSKGDATSPDGQVEVHIENERTKVDFRI